PAGAVDDGGLPDGAEPDGAEPDATDATQPDGPGLEGGNPDGGPALVAQGPPGALLLALDDTSVYRITTSAGGSAFSAPKDGRATLSTLYAGNTSGAITPTGIAVSNTDIFIASSGPPQILQIDKGSLAVTARIDQMDSPRALTRDPSVATNDGIFW